MTEIRLAPHDRELIIHVLSLLKETRQPSPYEYIREAFAEQACDVRSHWEQVGSYLQRAMDEANTRPTGLTRSER